MVGEDKMDIDCPECNKNHELDCDDLPDNACDSKEFECDTGDGGCGFSFEVGWRAEAEIRSGFSGR